MSTSAEDPSNSAAASILMSNTQPTLNICQQMHSSLKLALHGRTHHTRTLPFCPDTFLYNSLHVCYQLLLACGRPAGAVPASAPLQMHGRSCCVQVLAHLC
jgi:hypothetical protein